MLSVAPPPPRPPLLIAVHTVRNVSILLLVAFVVWIVASSPKQADAPQRATSTVAVRASPQTPPTPRTTDELKQDAKQEEKNEALSFVQRPASTAALATTPPTPPETAAQLKQKAKDDALYAEAARDVCAKVMENNLLGEGYNVDVNALGPHHTTLRLKWILVSKVTAYQFSQQSDTIQKMKELGFKKFTITDGYDESWTWTL